MNTIYLSDWSKFPGPRLKEYGKFSAEEFYYFFLPLLTKSISKKEKLILDLDGTYGIALSFIDELSVRLREEFGEYLLKDFLLIKSNEDPDLIEKIWTTIEIL